LKGPTEDPDVLAIRERKKRSFLATLLFSQGIPMILAGDELGHTQGGNNNAYCQDNEITWLNWNLNERHRKLLQFSQFLVKLRHEQPVFQRRRFFHGKPIEGAAAADIVWLNTDGSEMTTDAWNSSFVRCLGVILFESPFY
jgi:glycogen operon protein